MQSQFITGCGGASVSLPSRWSWRRDITGLIRVYGADVYSTDGMVMFAPTLMKMQMLY